MLQHHLQKIVLVFILITCAGIFISDSFVLAEMDLDFLYVLPVLATIFTHQRNTTLGITALSFCLILVGAALRIEYGYTAESWIGRLVALICLTVTALLCGQFKKSLVQLDAQQKTVEKLYSERLRAVEQFERIFEQVSEGIIVVNSYGRMVLLNSAAARIFGYKKEELEGEVVEKLIPNHLNAKHQAHRTQYAQHPRNRAMGADLDLYGKKSDNTEFPLAISLSPLQTDEGRFTIAFILDITERKQYEASIRQMNAHLEELVVQRTSALQKSMAFQHALVNYAGVIIIATNSEGVIQLFNPEAEKKLGYSATEVIGNHTPLLFHDMEMVKERAEQFSIELNTRIQPDFDVFTAKALRNLPNEYEWIFVTKNKVQFPVKLIVTALRNAEGAVTGYAGFAVDITLQKVLEENLLSALQKEKELNELKSRFVSMASHEFRTPLTGIASSASLITRYADRQDISQIKKHSDLIRLAVDNLNNIIADFLSLGKLEEGMVQVKIQEFSLRDFIEEIQEELNTILKPGQQIKYNHEGPAIIKQDSTILKNVLLNLLGNAAKYSPENAIIQVASNIKDQKASICITDQGIGIPPQDMEHLFTRFFRASNVSTIKGTGLGLYIVKRYVELLNGRIFCNSELGRGSTFTVEFDKDNQLKL